MANSAGKTIAIVLLVLIIAGTIGFAFVMIRAAKSVGDDVRVSNGAREEVKAAVVDVEAREKAELVSSPDRFLETSDPVYYDKGIINDYRTLNSITVLNRTKYAVKDMAGDVEWLNDSGQKMGSIPFTLKGSLAGGDTKTFKKDDGTLSNGTLAGKATKVRVTFTRVSLVQP